MTSKRSLFTKLVPVLFVAALLIIATFGSSAANLPFFGGGDNNVAPHTGSLAPGHSAPGRRYAALMNSLAPLTATVQTDKADYHPGEYVVVTGSGWQAGENVELKFIDGLCAGPHLFTTLADGSGLISNSDFLVTSSHLGLTIYLTATGQSSGFTASTSFTDSEALGVPGNAGGFEVESNFFSGNVGGTGIATGADWSGANPVLLQSGGNSIPGFNVATNAIWTVDEYVGSGSPFTIDPTSFTGGQKNDDLIGVGSTHWGWTEGSSQQKNDITNVLVHTRLSAGQRWLIFGLETRSVNGASYVDLEYNQSGITKSGTTSGLLTGGGPLGGRTLGDLLLVVDYTQGGGVPFFELRTWTNVGCASGCWSAPAALPAGVAFLTANSVNVPAVAPGAGVAGDGTPGQANSLALQVVEGAINLTAFNIPDLNPCNPLATVSLKSRASPSFTSSLSDFSLFAFRLQPPTNLTTSGGGEITCSTASRNLTATSTTPGANICWNGPGVVNVCSASPNVINVTQAGTYTASATSADFCPNSSDQVVTLNNTGPTVSSTKADPACNGGTGSMTVTFPGAGPFQCSLDGGPAAACTSPAVFSGLSASGGAGTAHTVVVTNTTNGCFNSTVKNIIAPTDLDSTETHNNVSCFGGSNGSIDITPSGGTPGYTYLWNDGVTTTQDRTGLAPGNYSVTITDANGCTEVENVTITAPAELTVSLGEITCGTGSSITATVNGGSFPYTYVWEIQGGTFNPQPGPGDNTATYNTQSGTVQIKVTVTDNNQCTDDVTVQADCGSHEVFCTLTQGAYGNAKGKAYLGDQKVNRLQLITALLETDIVLGVVGEKSLTIPGGASAAASAACIIKRLPGGTSAKELYGNDTAAPVDRTLDSACNTTPQPAGLNKSGRWENILLSQTLTLELNTRWDAHGDAGLKELELCRFMAARDAVLVIDQNGHVTYEDTAPNCPGNISAVGLPEAVMAELGPGATVADLLALANRALAGLPTDSTLSEIGGAVGAINELFDECKFLIYCSDTTPFTFPLPCLNASAPAVNGSQVNTSAQTATPAVLPEVFRRDSFRSLISRDGFLSNIMRTDTQSYGSS